MKVLNLIIKQKYFDAILSGEKTEEYREIRPTTFRKYCRYIVEGKKYERLEDYKGDTPFEDLEFDVEPIQYDAIRLYVGYNKDRDSALVKVKNCIIEFFVDENDEDITYEYNGTTYCMSQMVYELGEVLEKQVKPRKTIKNKDFSQFDTLDGEGWEINKDELYKSL